MRIRKRINDIVSFYESKDTIILDCNEINERGLREIDKRLKPFNLEVFLYNSYTDQYIFQIVKIGENIK